MNKDTRIIYRAFAGKLVGTPKMKVFVCETLSKMSADIISFVTRHCWFLSSMEDAWAFTFTGNDVANQHLIFLSDELFQQHPSQIFFTIAHEIGHVILKHRNSTIEKQPTREIRLQERAADLFANQFGFYRV